jgi:hypothetical protein
MRVTIDLDSKNPFILFWVLLKGLCICKKLPDSIRKSPNKKGYHIIWSGLNITENQMLRYRRLIGDDENRIKLDSSSKKRVKQILFTKKRVRY